MKNKYLIYIKYIKKLKMNYTNLRKNLNTTNIIKKTIAIQGVVKNLKKS
jgi:hypothetical protein